MTSSDSYEIRLSRAPLCALFVAGCLFAFAGLDIGFMHSVFPAFDIAPGKKIIFWLFLLFFVGFGTLIAVQMLLYILNPPVMFRASAEGISFGTGFRYALHAIPWRHVESIGGGIDAVQAAANRKLVGGLQITFRQSPDIPLMMPTSIGVSFVNYTLTLSWFYMGDSLSNAIEEVNALQKRYAAR